ncbi:MAG: hypothetical protein F9K16_02325 [Thermoanaerobaculia bacterium]|nr:MAG: hypothetical protein F9K16_02325 [Thermoanaerobaculia bacterium]MBZ0101369.1 hypothetical protein [Thermoanaerobaculia bacterium]
MHRDAASLVAALALAFLAPPSRSEAACAGPATSFLIEAEVVDCSTPEPLIREKVERFTERRRKALAIMAESIGESPKAIDQAETEAFVQERLQTGDVVATLLIRRSRRFTGDSNVPSADGDWQTIENPKPEKYLVSIGTRGCSALPIGEEVLLYAPFQCCDTYPGSNSCMLHLPLAIDVPEALLEHSRSDG